MYVHVQIRVLIYQLTQYIKMHSTHKCYVDMTFGTVFRPTVCLLVANCPFIYINTWKLSPKYELEKCIKKTTVCLHCTTHLGIIKGNTIINFANSIFFYLSCKRLGGTFSLLDKLIIQTS